MKRLSQCSRLSVVGDQRIKANKRNKEGGLRRGKEGREPVSLFCNLWFKQGPALYKEPWTGRAVSHFTLDTELSTSPGHAIRLEAGNSNLLR